MTNGERDALRVNLFSLIKEQISCEDFSAQTSFAELLHNFIHLEFTEEEAVRHWENILLNNTLLQAKLDRKPGVHLALVDYFTNVNHLLSAPMLIEIGAFKQTEQLAMIDALTGIFNRRYMDLVLKKEFNRCERYLKNMSVCLLDIDNFKKINDTKGHTFGDVVLKELAVMLKETIREEDVACRYGGEEFLVILPETDTEGANILTDRLSREIKNRPFFVDNGITFSGGTATYPEAARTIDGLVQAADRALYRAKYAGKDRILVAEPERRKFGRFEHSWSLDIFHKQSLEPITGIYTKNVSRGGVQFKCDVRYSIDTPLDLVFANINPETRNVEAKGRITWVRKIPKSYVYGVSFIDTTELFESSMSAQLHSVL